MKMGGGREPEARSGATHQQAGPAPAEPAGLGSKRVDAGGDGPPLRPEQPGDHSIGWPMLQNLGPGQRPGLVFSELEESSGQLDARDHASDYRQA